MGLAEEPAAVAGFAFGSALSSSYGWGKALRGWESSCLAVQASLAEWQPPRRMKPAWMTVRDPQVAELRHFLEQLPGPEVGKIEVIYLGAQHTREGAWQLTGRGSRALGWGELLEKAPRAHPCRIVILDVCHAAAVTGQPLWAEKMGAAATLLASGADEVTWELDFTKRQPVDLATRFPAATAWLKGHLPATWDRRLSYLGLIWVQAYLQTPEAPQTRREWQVFFGRCEAESRKFQQQIGRKRASSVSQFPALP
jgi:hypothetical protein